MLTPDLPGTGGRIRDRNEDFVVHEVPAYEPSGEGTHLFVRIEKRGITTDDAVALVAEHTGVPRAAIGFAGRKDKHAVTTQWFSVPDLEPDRLLGFEAEGMKVLDARRHGNKLRTGHARGNEFRIVIRDVVPDALRRATAIISRIEAEGLPNLFGEQRFGWHGHNVEHALDWIVSDGRKPRTKSLGRLLVSSLQAVLFNQVVEERLSRGLFSTGVLPGDVVKRHDTGGMFVVDDVDEVSGRVRANRVSPTGPIYGAKMWWPEREAFDFEEGILAAAGLSRTHLGRFKAYGKGSRRSIRVFPSDLDIVQEGDDLSVSFFLESGAFATTLLAEITKTVELVPMSKLTPRGE
jgi:tRNA pseudouridine13 synthase